MRYWKITMENGYCGCEEVELVADEDNADLNLNVDGYLQNYGFAEPDARFIGEEDDYESEEEYQEAYDFYVENLSACVEELTYEEYLAECDNYGVTPVERG